jgi:hypothetical protein
VKPISAILPQLCRQLSGNEKSKKYLISAVWRSIVGEPLCFCTQPVEYCGKKLVIKVPSATWRKQLTLLQSEIIKRLNELLDSGITNLEFQIDTQLESSYPKKALDQAQKTPQPVKLPLKGILDKELRDSVELVASLYLNRLK